MLSTLHRCHTQCYMTPASPVPNQWLQGMYECRLMFIGHCTNGSTYIICCYDPRRNSICQSRGYLRSVVDTWSSEALESVCYVTWIYVAPNVISNPLQLPSSDCKASCELMMNSVVQATKSIRCASVTCTDGSASNICSYYPRWGYTDQSPYEIVYVLNIWFCEALQWVCHVK